MKQFVRVLVYGDKKVLFVRQPDGVLTLPGGQAKPRESLVAAASRYLDEQTGLLTGPGFDCPDPEALSMSIVDGHPTLLFVSSRWDANGRVRKGKSGQPVWLKPSDAGEWFAPINQLFSAWKGYLE